MIIKLKNLIESWKDGKDPRHDHCSTCYGEEFQGGTGELRQFKLLKKYDTWNKGDLIDICQDCYKKLNKKGFVK